MFLAVETVEVMPIIDDKIILALWTVMLRYHSHATLS